MGCINSQIIRDMARKVSLDRLNVLKERKDKLVSRLFMKKFVTHVRETYRISWREIYWKVWSFLYVFRCERCSVFHHISELGNCRVHK